MGHGHARRTTCVAICASRPSRRICHSDAEQVAQVVEMVGPELLLYASDHPHEHGDGIERLLGALSDEDAEAILHGNARRFYGGSIA